MKRILQNSFGKAILSLIVALVSMPASANNIFGNYFTRAYVHAAVGEGKVYAGKTNQAPSSTDYKTNHEDYQESGNQTHTWYLYAQPSQNYYFAGWYENASCTGTLLSTNIPYQTELRANGRGSSNGTEKNYYAKFVAFDPVTFSVDAGSYYEPQSVTLSCNTSGATIEYSLNNQNNWQGYTTGAIISVPSTTTIYARAKKNQGQSDVYSATYTILPKNSVVFITEKSIPFADGDYTLTTGTSDGFDVKTDGDISSVSVTGNDKIASVSGSIITPLAVGTTTITVASDEGSTYQAGNGTITVNVTAPEGVETAPSGEYTETYKIPASGYGTYCSQYPIDFTRSFLNGETAYTVKEKTETLVRLHLIEQTSIKGGVGFVVKGTPGTTITFRFTDSSNVPTPNMLFGTTAPTYIEYEAAYGMKDGGFHLNNAGVVPAHRAFIPNGSAGSVKALTLEFEEEDPTGIEEFKFEDDSNSVIYNLSGQRINKMQRGINIVNGKKIMVK